MGAMEIAFLRHARKAQVYMNNHHYWVKAILFLFITSFTINLIMPSAVRAQGSDTQGHPAPASTVRFGHLTADDGLVDNSITAILQDSRGFMWFGTPSGLSRYDGYRFTTYQHDDKNPNSLSHNNISRLMEDKDGMIWIATQGGGVNKFDPRTETFTRYLPDFANPTSIHNIQGDQVRSLYQDSDGFLWFGSAPNNSLNRFDPQTQTFSHYLNSADKPAPVGMIFDILETSPGALWLLSDFAVGKFDVATQRLTPYKPPVPDEKHLSRLHEDVQGNLWATGQRGLYEFDAKQDSFVNYPFPSQLNNILDDNDTLLVAGSNGLYRFDPKTGHILKSYQHDSNHPDSLSSSNIQALYRDRSGVVWIGTGDGGVNIYDPRQAHFINYQHDTASASSLSDGAVNSVSAGDQNHLWVGVGNVLNQVDLTTGEVAQFTPDILTEPTARINAVLQDHSGMVWLGLSNLQLLQFDSKTSQFSDYHFKSQAPPNLPTPPKAIVDLHEAKDGALWIAVNHDGLYRLDAERKDIQFFQSPIQGKIPTGNSGPNNAPRPPIDAISEDHEGNIWVSSWNGVSRLDPKTGTYKQYRTKSDAHGPDYWFNMVYEDHSGKIWLASRVGLFRLDAESGAYKQYTEADGLPSSNVIGIVEDGSGNLWLGTAKGLSKFTPSTEVFRNYDKADGLQQTPSHPQSMALIANGQMVFGGTSGLTIFDPDQITDNPYQPTVVLTDFQLFNKPVQFGKDSPLAHPIWATESLTLQHDQNILSFEFAALNYASPQKNHYRYKLEGFDDDWSQTDSSRRFVTYTNLPAGNYVFRVQGSNNNGVWSNQEAALRLNVLPPWWETTPFRGAVALLILALLWGIYRWRLRAIQQRNRDLEKLVTERTQTLQAREEQLRYARDAAEAANRAKSAFLANMSHELRTPLNVIMGFAQVTNRNQSVSPDAKENLDIILRSGEHLLTLVNQVLDLSKIEAGRMTLNLSDFDLYQVLEDLEAMFTLKANDKHLKLRFERSDDVPRYLRTDELKLRQVLMNLINNALKFTEQGSVTVSIHIQNLTNELHFDIEDTGPGIAPADMNSLFEAFTQARNGHTGQEGTGLGLPISRRFVQLLGGDIKVESQVGRGSTFRFTVTYQAVDATSHVRGSKNQRQVVALAEGQPRYRILVVDDRAANRHLLLKLLVPLGFDLREAENGNEALEITPIFKPHLVLLDMRMQVMDGYETVRRLRTMPDGKTIVVIALTASAFEGDRAAVIAAGCDDFLQKPFRAEHILEIFGERLGVQYVYADNPRVAQPGIDAPKPEILAAELSTLPRDLLTRLSEGIELGDVTIIDKAISDIRGHNSTLADILGWLADHFEYSKLLHLLRETA